MVMWENDMHPLNTIPTCEKATEICTNNSWCRQRLDDFTSTCTIANDKCSNPDREGCIKAWLRVRETPLLGCICPNVSDQECIAVQSLVNSNPCVETNPEDSLRQIKHIVGTCQTALHSCRQHPGCKSQLESVASRCRITYCHPKTCRDAVSSLYGYLMKEDPSLALHIGLCICRRTGDRSDTECVNAQGYLHPECAERSDQRAISHCHRLGRQCRDDNLCRYRLEYYEQACAADILTGRCAGQHRECRKAAMGLFGSPLHVNCVCKGDDFNPPSKCLTWKRVMWGNPCVVESQLTYYLGQLGPNIKLPPSFHDNEYVKLKQSIYENIFGEIQLGNSFSSNYGNPNYGTGEVVYDQRPYDASQRGAYSKPIDTLNPVNAQSGSKILNRKEESISQARRLESTVSSPVTHSNRGRGVSHYKYPQSTTTLAPPTWNPAHFNSFTTTVISTSPLPEKYCKVSRDWDDNRPRIIEAKGSIRLYKNGNKDCSEICECTENEETYCKVMDCTENIPCETSYAVYNHNAPAYQASRGECICYSGDFICMRPKEGEYNLPAGLFLLLGFSHKEEALLRSVTNGGAVDALFPLQKLVRTISDEMGGNCHFELYQNTSDNFVLHIMSRDSPAIFGNSSYASHRYNLKRLLEERDQCKPVVEKVADMINKRHYKIHHHVRLSLFVLAEVLDKIPSALRSSEASTTSTYPFTLATTVLQFALPLFYPTNRLRYVL